MNFNKKFKLRDIFMKKQKLKIYTACFLSLFCSPTYAAVFDVEAHGVYGGFWRDLYKFGPVVIDTVGGDLGIFVNNDFKIGFSFATVAGLLSRNEKDDVFDAINGSYGTPDRYSGFLSALEPTDFTYSTAALKLEYLFYNGSTFGWSSTTNLGQGVYGQGKIVNESGLPKDSYHSFPNNYATLGFALIIKFTQNLRMSFGVSQRKDLDKNNNKRTVGFENLDAVSIYNHVYLVKF